MEESLFIAWIILVSILSGLWLVLIIINILRRLRYHPRNQTNPGTPPSVRISATAMFFGNLIVYLLMIGVCFLLYDPSPEHSNDTSAWPYTAFLIWVILLAIAESVSAFYFILPGTKRFTDFMQWFHEKIGVNPFKGWGGETFGDLSNGVGVMVAVGVNLVIVTDDSRYWWAGQIAAIMSVMSAVAWVQRYAFENPDDDRPFWKEIFPTCLSAAAAMLTGLAVMVPIEGNIVGRNAAGLNGVSGIFLLWMIVFIMWMVIALIPLIIMFTRRNNLNGIFPSWPRVADISNASQPTNSPANRRGLIIIFLSLMFILGITAIVFISIWWNSPDEVRPVWVGALIGLTTAVIFVLGQFIKFAVELSDFWANSNDPNAVNNGYEILKCIKNFVFLITGGVLLWAQAGIDNGATQGWMAELWFFIPYITALVLIGLFSIIGVLADSIRMIVKWKSPLRLRLPPVSQEIQMTPVSGRRHTI